MLKSDKICITLLLLWSPLAVASADLSNIPIAHEYTPPASYQPEHGLACPIIVGNFQLPDPTKPKNKNTGLLTENVSMTLATLIEAYQRGIFPWSDDGVEKAGWYAPPARGVVILDEFHVPKSLGKFLRNKNPYTVTFDTAFERVIRACAESDNRMDGKVPVTETWISPLFLTNYNALFAAGYAHSVEVWQDGELVGGLYGVHMNGVFAGESMFYKADGASKVAFVALIAHLQARGLKWIDVQVPNSLTQQFGAKDVLRETHLAMLHEAHQHPIPFYRP